MTNGNYFDIYPKKTGKGVETISLDLTCHFFVRHTISEMENFKFQFYVAY